MNRPRHVCLIIASALLSACSSSANQHDAGGESPHTDPEPQVHAAEAHPTASTITAPDTTTPDTTTPDTTTPDTTTPNITPPDGSATLDGRSIHYVARGWDNIRRPREAVVLVHGWASNSSAWDNQIDVLAKYTRVIAIDLPGHGASQLPAEPCSMDLFARAIAAVMDDAGIDAAVLVGHSNGTPTIRQFYRDFPDRTRALVIVDGGLKSFFSAEAAKPFLEQLQSPEYRPFVTSMVEGMLQANPDATKAERDMLVQMALSTPQETLVGALEAGVDPAIWIDDPINVPTLVVLADAPFWTDEYEGFVRDLVPDVEYHKLAGVSHFLMYEDPQTFNALLLDFLRRIDFIPQLRAHP